MNPDLPTVAVIKDFLTERIRESVAGKSWVVILNIVQKEDVVGFFFSDNREIDNIETKSSDEPEHADTSRYLSFPEFEEFIRDCGGQFEAKVQPEMGLSLFFTLPQLPEYLPEMLLALLQIEGDFDILISRQNGDLKYSINRLKLREKFGKLTDPVIVPGLLRYIEEQETAIKGGK